MFGLNGLITGIYVATILGIPIFAEIILRSKWWKQKSDYYFSFNEKPSDVGGKEKGVHKEDHLCS